MPKGCGLGMHKMAVLISHAAIRRYPFISKYFLALEFNENI